MAKIKWAPLIPLIGGFPLGAEKAIGHKPDHIISYEAFGKNDSHLCEHWSDVPYVQIDNPEHRSVLNEIEGYDLMVMTPPCAGLSMLNTGKSADVKGADAAANDWIYESAIYAMHNWRPKVIIGENAPGLYTVRGEAVVERLRKIADDNGYSLSLYKTNTIYHGLPQSRERAFYFFWDKQPAPILNWYREPYTPFAEWLEQIPSDATQQDLVINQRLMDEPYYQFIKAHFKSDDARDLISETSHTAHNFIMKKNLLNEFVSWCEKYHEKGFKIGSHAVEKYAIGKGVWDSSTHVFTDHMNAVIGRNLQDTIHPYENRSLNVREALHMMGFPHDFILQGGLKSVNHIAQNVPVNTAACMVHEALAFIKNQHIPGSSMFMRQNNHTNKCEYEEPNTLEAFIS